jgi:hypothetical protein
MLANSLVAAEAQRIKNPTDRHLASATRYKSNIFRRKPAMTNVISETGANRLHEQT